MTVQEKEKSLNDLILKWALKIADEIKELGREAPKTIRTGDLSDALQEAHQVLILAEEDDLAEEVRNLRVEIESIRGEIIDRGRYYYRLVKVEPTKKNIIRLADKIKERIQSKANQ
ncbi:MAG: hypothetical protein F7C36_01840 [Desulfurococcales archaeon]|nr:hypothetical protein [Desulfurococcales archaeon]